MHMLTDYVSLYVSPHRTINIDQAELDSLAEGLDGLCTIASEEPCFNSKKQRTGTSCKRSTKPTLKKMTKSTDAGHQAMTGLGAMGMS
jgi:hypothetical protein